MFDVLALAKESLTTPQFKSHNRLELSSVSETECGETACYSACWRLDCRDHRHSRWRYNALSPLIGLREPSRLPSSSRRTAGPSHRDGNREKACYVAYIQVESHGYRGGKGQLKISLVLTNGLFRSLHT